MRKSLYAKIALCVCFLLTHPVSAADISPMTEPSEPTKAQTVDYILARINDVNLGGGTSWVRTSSKTVKLMVKHLQQASIDDCLLTIHETRYENDVLMLEKTMTVPLSRLNPATVGADDRSVYLVSVNDGAFVEQSVTSRQNAKIQPVDHQMTAEMPVYFAMGQGEKLARAFAHLIKLCGGHKDLF
ncbi:MAG: hypothetical protein WAL90_06820 [Desulfobacterales bacterium]